jgi:hypothetical protein
MSLPKLKHPTFELTIPSSKKKINVRPFVTKEEKILLIAKESGEYGDIIRAVKQIVSNCIVSSDVNVDSLPTFDLEYLFIRIRALSVSNIITPKYLDTEDQKEYDFPIDLNKIEVTFPADVNKKIDCGSGVVMVMKYPSCSLYSEKEYIEITETELAFDYLFKSCIESIHQVDKSYDLKTTSDEELREFIDNLPIPAYNLVKSFLFNLPKVEHTINYTNTNGTERKIVLSSLNDFFLFV